MKVRRGIRTQITGQGPCLIQRRVVQTWNPGPIEGGHAFHGCVIHLWQALLSTRICKQALLYQGSRHALQLLTLLLHGQSAPLAHGPPRQRQHYLKPAWSQMPDVCWWEQEDRHEDGVLGHRHSPLTPPLLWLGSQPWSSLCKLCLCCESPPLGCICPPSPPCEPCLSGAPLLCSSAPALPGLGASPGWLTS